MLTGQTKSELRRLNLRARKGLGQHFLVDEQVLSRLISAVALTPGDTVIEVGPGLGILTRELAKSETGHSPELWKKMAELFWTGIIIPEEYGGAGHEYFKRYFFPQANKKAIIVDERHNGGGQLADYYIDILKKPYQASWNFRYGNDLKSPSASIQGPKVMIIDETAGSGGDYLPWMFRKFKLGTIIGKTTWGGLVGVLGYPEFIDGGSVTAPNLAFWNEDGYRVENEGVPPDIKVEQWPKAVISGGDPQLEKAIEVILEQLKSNPPVTPKRPEYPVRVRKSN